MALAVSSSDPFGSLRNPVLTRKYLVLENFLGV